jgi:FtsP/CotA-like multicopper oxidase with cupredoxin domain
LHKVGRADELVLRSAYPRPHLSVLLRLSIDQHPFQVVEVDDTPVYGPVLHGLPIAVGQRYYIVVNTTEGTVGDVFWLRANAAVGG